MIGNTETLRYIARGFFERGTMSGPHVELLFSVAEELDRLRLLEQRVNNWHDNGGNFGIRPKPKPDPICTIEESAFPEPRSVEPSPRSCRLPRPLST